MMQNTWKVINNILRPDRSSNSIHKIIKGNEAVVGDKNIEECLNDYFVNIGSFVAGQILPEPRAPACFLKGDFAESFILSPTTPDLVKKMISSLQKKAGSLNTFPTTVLKFLSPLISARFSVLINK